MPEPVTTAAQGSSTESSTRLTGNLGTAAIVLMVVAAAAPLTTLGGNVPLMIALGQGVGAPVGFLIAGAVFALFAGGFVAMTHYVDSAGAFYAYVERGLGARPGMGAAFVAYAAYIATMIAVYGYIGAILSGMVSDLTGTTVPWWTMTAAVIVAIGLLGYRHIDLSAKVLGIFLVAEIAVVVVLDLVIVLRGGSDGLTGDSFTPAGISGGLGVAILFALFGFVGVEATAVFRDEAKDPQRTIRRATYWSVAIIAVFYAISSWAVIEGNGGSNAVAIATDDPDNFVLNTARLYLGVLGRDVTQVLLAVSLFAAALSFHNIASRYQFVLARKGVLPAALGKAHPRHAAPSYSSFAVSIVSLLIMAVFALLDLDPLLEIFGPMGGIGIAGLASLWLLTSISIAVFFHKKGGSRRTVALAGASALTLALALVLILWNLPVIVGGTVLLAVLIGLVPLVFFMTGMLVRSGVARQ
ncbi:APC family permease [Rhodococcus qingshengii]|uniref:APC family permease n=1 Tax=Rhodococcus qingshengii TaxID=334542 RepID=A0AAW6LT71_RHOSG|nr:APC family permease [Rhodococcus qingshengii]MDE8649904.1 APC family permease [Rhodococcus qingshengii]